MSISSAKQLHWTQRIAVVCHNLHCAARSGQFGFFKSLQASGFLDGTNHFAALATMMGDGADVVSTALDNLNDALALAHQDAFQHVYDYLKTSLKAGHNRVERSKLHFQVGLQKKKADMAIDTLSNLAITLINRQPTDAQEAAANVYMTGITLVADCVEVVMQQLNALEQEMDDITRLDESMNAVKASVLGFTAGLKGIYYMLDQTNAHGEPSPRAFSVSSAGSMFRRISNAFAASPISRSGSLASAGAARSSFSEPYSAYRTPECARNIFSIGCPPSMPTQLHNFDTTKFNFHQGHQLSPVPTTPAADEEKDPFDTTDVPPVPAITIADHRMSTAVM